VPEPALAAVVVSYESAGDLPETLVALTAQLRPGDELVVVDNASTDGSAAAARAAAPDATVVELATNEGFAGGCLAGVARTTAPLLFFLNPDARITRGCLDQLRAAAREQPSWGAWQALVVLPGGALVNTSGGVVHWLGIAWSGDIDTPVAAVRERPHEVGFASGAALVVRREAWDATRGFDADWFMYGEDVDLSLRLRLAGWGVGVVPAARVEHGYGFEKGAYKWFHLERNRWWMLIAAYPAPLLALVLPALLVFDVGLLAVAARGGWLGAKLRAQAAVLRTLPRAVARRRAVQATRTVAPAAFAASLTPTLDSPYLGGPANIAAVRALQAGYWRLVRALLPG
jgi:N-acetylglucosaminyl-diphospho-decaprenol L-rhamnosyltransferase